MVVATDVRGGGWVWVHLLKRRITLETKLLMYSLSWGSSDEMKQGVIRQS